MFLISNLFLGNSMHLLGCIFTGFFYKMELQITNSCYRRIILDAENAYTSEVSPLFVDILGYKDGVLRLLLTVVTLKCPKKFPSLGVGDYSLLFWWPNQAKLAHNCCSLSTGGCLLLFLKI